jgi:hypothetical protein
MTAINGARRERLYIIGFILCGIMLLGTAGAAEIDSITMGEAIWQICVSTIGGLWFWNMIRIEETRACRYGRRARG